MDTNIVLHHLEAIDRFINDIQSIGLPVMIIVPGVVINELDGYGCCVDCLEKLCSHDYHRQKNRDGLAWFARRASAWLLKKVQQRRSVKGQSLEETCKPSRNWKTKDSGEVRTTIITPVPLTELCPSFHRSLVQNAQTMDLSWTAASTFFICGGNAPSCVAQTRTCVLRRKARV